MIVKHTKKKKWDDGPLLQMWCTVQAILGISDCLSIEIQTDTCIYIAFTFLFSIRTEYSLFWCISEPKYIGTLLYIVTKHGNDNSFTLRIIWKITHKPGFSINNYIFIWLNTAKPKHSQFIANILCNSSIVLLVSETSSWSSSTKSNSIIMVFNLTIKSALLILNNQSCVDYWLTPVHNLSIAFNLIWPRGPTRSKSNWAAVGTILSFLVINPLLFSEQ